MASAQTKRLLWKAQYPLSTEHGARAGLRLCYTPEVVCSPEQQEMSLLCAWLLCHCE